MCPHPRETALFVDPHATADIFPSVKYFFNVFQKKENAVPQVIHITQHLMDELFISRESANMFWQKMLARSSRCLAKT